jgi:GxxExxY protein
MAELLHKDLSYKLNGVFFEIHNRLGRFLNHKQYCDALEILLKKYNINYRREVSVPINFEGFAIGGNRIDFDVEDLIIIDVKTEQTISEKDYQQMQRYLKARNRKLGLIVNFHDPSIGPKRIINSKGEV